MVWARLRNDLAVSFTAIRWGRGVEEVSVLQDLGQVEE